MAEDTEGPEIEIAPPSSSNQNIVMGIVMGAAVLLLLVLVITKKFNTSGNNVTDPAVAELRKELDAKRKKAISYASPEFQKTHRLSFFRSRVIPIP